jgi:hypothetical protein
MVGPIPQAVFEHVRRKNGTGTHLFGVTRTDALAHWRPSLFSAVGHLATTFDPELELASESVPPPQPQIRATFDRPAPADAQCLRTDDQLEFRPHQSQTYWNVTHLSRQRVFVTIACH